MPQRSYAADHVSLVLFFLAYILVLYPDFRCLEQALKGEKDTHARRALTSHVSFRQYRSAIPSCRD